MLTGTIVLLLALALAGLLGYRHHRRRSLSEPEQGQQPAEAQCEMLALRKYVLSPQEVSAIPDADRALMIWCGQIHDELMTFLGARRAVANTSTDSATELEAKVAQELAIAKVVAGKLWEGWALLEKGFFGNSLSKRYEPLLDPGTKESLGALKKYFRHSPRLYALRNSYAFHYDYDALKTLPDGWDHAPDDLHFYVGPVPAQSLFFLSEAIVNRSMFIQLGAGNLADGVQRFWDDIGSMANALIAVTATLFGTVLQEHVGGPTKLASVTVGVVNPPSIDAPTLPFFVLIPVTCRDRPKPQPM
ncbi:MAG: hypothetical protein K9K30_16635 [Burkholderiaceae bacterium]|nr:hypothetical protein [Sulfuritalea sp.]MCF8176862.1 hypothetical protein [Burkholderiaceae bacterium]MCF8184004.1 hypothetical protein [Polynucleobacter sp.]